MFDRSEKWEHLNKAHTFSDIYSLYIIELSLRILYSQIDAQDILKLIVKEYILVWLCHTVTVCTVHMPNVKHLYPIPMTGELSTVICD